MAIVSHWYFYSTDGINWTPGSYPLWDNAITQGTAVWADYTVGGVHVQRFVAFSSIASPSSPAAYSTDGLNWTAATFPSFISASESALTPVAIGTSLAGGSLGVVGSFINLSIADRIAGSVDGSSWVDEGGTVLNDAFRPGDYMGGLFMIPGSSAFVATSPDGITYTNRTPATIGGGTNVSKPFMVKSNAGRWLLGSTPGSTPHNLLALVSTTDNNGVNWATRLSTGAANSNARGVIVYNPDTATWFFYGVDGNGNNYATSTDNGTTWVGGSSATAPSTTMINAVYVSSLGLFVAGTTGGSAGSASWYSSDGINWTAGTLHGVPSQTMTVNWLTYSPALGMFILSGNQQFTVTGGVYLDRLAVGSPALTRSPGGILVPRRGRYDLR